jgi:predicted HicB family RNase H-like nuclease
MHRDTEATPRGQRVVETIAVRVTPQMRIDLEQIAASQERSLGSLVRLALRAALADPSVLTP